MDDITDLHCIIAYLFALCGFMNVYGSVVILISPAHRPPEFAQLSDLPKLPGLPLLPVGGLLWRTTTRHHFAQLAILPVTTRSMNHIVLLFWSFMYHHSWCRFIWYIKVFSVPPARFYLQGSIDSILAYSGLPYGHWKCMSWCIGHGQCEKLQAN